MYKLASHMERAVCFVVTSCGISDESFLPLNSSQKSLCESSIEGLHPLLDFATVNAFWLCQYFVLISILMTAVEMSGSLIL